MRFRWETGARRVALLSFVIDIYHGIVAIVLLSSPFRARVMFALFYVITITIIIFSIIIIIFALQCDLCRSVNSVRTSMSSTSSSSSTVLFLYIVRTRARGTLYYTLCLKFFTFRINRAAVAVMVGAARACVKQE